MDSENSDQRPRGILTKTDREFLVGKKDEYSNQQKRDRRKQIRTRIRNGLLDFGLLWMFLEKRDLELIFSSGNETDTNLRKAIQDKIAFTLLGMEHLGDNKSLRLGGALLQAAEAGGEFPIEFALHYASQSDKERIEWTNQELPVQASIRSRLTWSCPENVSCSRSENPVGNDTVVR